MSGPSPDPSSRCDLVLEGGGVLGVAHVGALMELQARGYQVGRVAGSSVGALVGALAAAGMSPERMREVLLDSDLRRLTDRSLVDRVPLVGPLLSILGEDGVYEGEALRAWVAELLAECGVTTFGDLRLADGDPLADGLPEGMRYRLVLTATDTTLGRLVRLPWDYEPVYGLDPDTQSVADAVRASTSIPFFFEPASITAADGRASTLLDGGVLSNFPVDLLDRRDDETPRWPTFGLQLTGDLPAQAARRYPWLRLLRHGPVALLTDLVHTLIVGHDRARLALPWVAARTIAIDVGDVDPVDFGLDREAKQRLLRAGQEATAAFLDRWDFDAYVRRFRRTP